MASVKLQNGKTFSSESGTSLLDSAKAAGITLEYSCRTGRCGVCKTTVVCGETEAFREETSLTAEERAAGMILTCCRHAGLPARYVSGYLYSQDNRHVAMHAWAEVWIEERWHTFDVTNLTSSTSEHLKLAVGMDYLDACPVRGVRYGGGCEQLQSQAQVTRLDGQQQ
jgi:ferredoxin